jgi:hypothetical protein
MSLDDYLATTVALMTELRIPVRETYALPPKNCDDFMSNGDRYDGPRLLSIRYEETEGNARSEAKKKWFFRVFRGLIYAIAQAFQEMRDGQQGSVFRTVGLEAALDG